jgi:hypothetical protein
VQKQMPRPRSEKATPGLSVVCVIAWITLIQFTASMGLLGGPFGWPSHRSGAGLERTTENCSRKPDGSNTPAAPFRHSACGFCVTDHRTPSEKLLIPSGPIVPWPLLHTVVIETYPSSSTCIAAASDTVFWSSRAPPPLIA